MKATNIMLFLISINVSVYILIFSGAWAGQYPQSYASPTEMTSIFTIQNIDLTKILVASIGGILGGIIILFTRQYIFATIALLIWVICVLLTPIGWVISAFPLTIRSLILMSGAPVAIADMFQIVTSVFYAFIFFMFILEIAGQRQIL